jgi:hypothetical protein
MAKSSPALMVLGAERLLVESEAFRKRVGAADAAACKTNVHYAEKGLDELLKAGDTLAGQRPFAVVGVAQHSYAQIGQGAAIDLGATGGAYIVFSDNPREPKDSKASFIDFLDWIGSCIEDVAALVGQDDHFPFTAIHMVYDPHRPNISARTSDDYWVAAYVLTFSVNGGQG